MVDYINNKLINNKIFILNQKKADEIVLFWLIFASPIGFRFLPFGFVHIIFIIASIYFLIKVFFTRKLFLVDQVNIIFLMYLLYYITDQIYVNGSFKHFLNLLISYLYFFLIVNIGSNIDRFRIIKIFNKAVLFLMVFFCIEAIYRFTHRGGGDFLHSFKENSLFFMDSNFLGLDLIVLYFLLLIIKYKKSKIYRLMIFIFTLLSLSRAAIISIVLWNYVFSKVKNFKNLFKYSLVIIGILVLFVYYFYNDLIIDGSLRSKFIFAGQSISFMQQISVKNILFGNGVNSSIELFGHFLHNYFLVYIIDQGLLGVIFILYFHYSLAKNTNWIWLIVFIPYLMGAMAVVSYASHVVYMAAGLVYLLFDDKKKKILKI